MALLNINPIPVLERPWSVNPEKKTLVVEHSEIGSPQLYNRIYDDACDVGIALYNHATGNTVVWYLAEEIRIDGDLEVWVFKPIQRHVRRWPALAGWEVSILND